MRGLAQRYFAAAEIFARPSADIVEVRSLGAFFAPFPCNALMAARDHSERRLLIAFYFTFT